MPLCFSVLKKSELKVIVLASGSSNKHSGAIQGIFPVSGL